MQQWPRLVLAGPNRASSHLLHQLFCFSWANFSALFKVFWTPPPTQLSYLISVSIVYLIFSELLAELTPPL